MITPVCPGNTSFLFTMGFPRGF